MPLDDKQLASALMYPKVTRGFHGSIWASVRRHLGVCPRPHSSTACVPGDEVALEIDPGKTLLIDLLQSIHDDDEPLRAKVQFELNGQSRMVLGARALKSTGGARSAQREGRPKPATRCT
jgi:pyruvate carboxylase